MSSPPTELARDAEGAAGPGADVPELQLGQTFDPAELVHGDPAAIRFSASHLRAFSSAFSQTAVGLSGLAARHWTGSAADAFRREFTPHPARWREASSAAGNAGGALESYADAVYSAQDMARQAIDMYSAGQRATASAQAVYNQQVAAYNRAAQAYNARLAAGVNPGPQPEEPAAFSDPGATLRAEAEQVLGQARSSRDAAAAQAEVTIKTATGGAPSGPSSWSQVAGEVSELGAGGDGAAAGLSDAAGNPAVAARSPSQIPQAGDPVDVATGDVLLFQDDVSLPGVLPLVVGRAYRSSWQAGRWFGASWASTLDQRLQVSPGRVIGVFADGRVLSWPCAMDGDGPVPVPAVPVTGPQWQLERVRDDAFTVTDPQAGLVWRFERRPGYHWSAAGAGELPLVRVTDRAGHQISLGYTPAGRPDWIEHSGGYRIRVVMEGTRVAALALAGAEPEGDAGPQVPLVSYGYNPAGDLAAVISSAGQARQFRYDEEGRLTGWDDRNGISYQYSYDEQGRCVAGAGPGGAMSGRFAYGDRVTWWTDAAGAVTIYQLDESSRVTAVTDPLGNVTHFWYDESGRMVTRADPLGRLTRYEHDERGNLTCIARADGSQARAAYDEANLPVWLEAPDGTCWQQEYDPRGNLTRQIAPDGAATSYGYDEHGHLASVTGPLGAVIRVRCDPAGLPVAVTGLDGAVTRYTRDLFGRVRVITGPDGAATELAWTVEGQLSRRVFADGSSERMEYDAEGNLIARLSQAGERTSYEYGPFDLVTAMAGPDGSRTEFRYDQGLRLTAAVHAGLSWQYSYDAAGRLVAETDYNGATTRYAYDQAGQLTSRVNAVGQETACSYDEAGRVVKRAAGGLVTTYGYDAAGRLVRASNPDAEITLSRDPLGRVTAETCNGRAVLSEYDRAGRRSRRITPGGREQRWEYDDAGLPARLEAGGHVLRFGYDQAGREIRRDLPGGLALTQGWDVAGQLTSQVLIATVPAVTVPAVTVPAATVPAAAVPAAVNGGKPATAAALWRARRVYAYRAGGYLEGVDDLLTGPRRFTQDSGGRITAISGPSWAERYGYDPAGNISSACWTAPPPAAAGTWLATDVQGPRDRSGTLVTSAGSVRYLHDKQGRVIKRERALISREPAAWTYQWDADDRLTAVTTPDGSTWRYRYDPFGRRVAKQRISPSGALAEETTFTWDGVVLAEEVLAAAGASARESGRRRRVTWDYRPGTFTPLTQAETVSPDGAPREVIDQRFYTIITDQLGTPAELACPDGTLAGCQQHTLWGGTLWHPDGAATPLRFPGQYHDPETGLHYNQQRYYDPVTGSYLTPDPLGLAPGPNPHAYVPNPRIQADPLGLMSCSPPGAGGAPAGAGTRFTHFLDAVQPDDPPVCVAVRVLADAGVAETASWIEDALYQCAPGAALLATRFIAAVTQTNCPLSFLGAGGQKRRVQERLAGFPGLATSIRQYVLPAGRYAV